MYKPINGWTKAKMIEKIKQHLPDNGRCVNQRNYCMYKNNEGKRCAVGAFLPDDFDGFDCEGTVSELMGSTPDLANKLPLTVEPLSKLQTIHDRKYAGRGALTKSAKERCVAWVEENVLGE